MKKTDLESRIEELELEWSNLKSGAIATSYASKKTIEKHGTKFLILSNIQNLEIFTFSDA